MNHRYRLLAGFKVSPEMGVIHIHPLNESPLLSAELLGRTYFEITRAMLRAIAMHQNVIITINNKTVYMVI